MFDLAIHGNKPCLIEANGTILTYAEVDVLVSQYTRNFGDGHGLVLLGCENDVGTIIAYLAALRVGCPVLLVQDRNDQEIARLIVTFLPRYVKRAANSVPIQRDVFSPCHPYLAVMLSTSGSTGAAKAVRLSYQNIESNAASIAEYLEIESMDRAALTLPFYYSYGLSVINSHLHSGASVWLTEGSVTESGFWRQFAELQCTNFPGVPHSYQLLARNGFDSRTVPTLRHATQAGGHLSADLVKQFAEMAQRDGWRFYVMYGQTEASPRMAYVPHDLVLKNPETIGVAVPGGQLRIAGAEQPGDHGELVYSGPNVMMGYALSGEDLALPSQVDELHTGDLAIEQPDGLFRIVGRMSRFIKPFGLRISLDEVERHLANKGYAAVAAVGDDSELAIFMSEPVTAQAICGDVAAWLKLPESSVSVHQIDTIPRSESGKIDYAALNRQFKLLQESEGTAPVGTERNIRAMFARYFPGKTIEDTDSFNAMGGDSLKFIQFSIELENAIGRLPEDWEQQSVGELQARVAVDSVAVSRFWRPLDMAVFLRAYAILCVVTEHLGLWEWPPEGSSLLLVLAGMSFGRFQTHEVIRTGNTKAIWMSILRISIPTIGYVALLQILHRDFFLWSLLLVGNFYDLNAYTDQWFLDLYIQTFVFMGLLLSFRSVRIVALRHPVTATAILFAFSVLLRWLVPMVWDTSYADHRVPHYWFWLFAWGLMLSQVRSMGMRVIGIAVFMAASYAFYHEKNIGTVINLVVGASLVLFVPTIPWPSFMRRPFTEIAAATLFIYLTQFQIGAIAKALGGGPAIMVLCAIVGGIAVARGYAFAERLLLEWYSRNGFTWKDHKATRRFIRQENQS